jgi:DNA-binding CsgD family transcriptional regulator
VLVGRAAECARLRDLVAAAREDRAGVLLLRGDAGVGKSRLLEHCVQSAAGFRVLQIGGHESESAIPFAGLSWLLGPLTGLLPALPPVQAGALAGALQLGSGGPGGGGPGGGGPGGGGGDRLAVAAATLTLLAAAAERQPLLVAVDDAQWVDLPSLEAIVFAARRLHAEPIAVVLAARPEPDAPAEASALLAALPELPVGGLAPAAAAELLAAREIGLSADVLAERVAETGGNPLALLELPALAADALPVEPLRIGSRLEESFGQRVAAVPGLTRQAMLLLAAAGAAAGDVLAAALDRHGLSAADLEPAETAGLVRTDCDGVRFRHPLVRSALYQRASPAERRAAHRALAAAFAGLDTPWARERYGWHLAAATIGPDEQTAAALDAAAAAAAARRSYATAMDLHERAARMSPPGDGRARRLLAAAHLGMPAGRVDASLPLLDRVHAESADWKLRTEARHLRCRIEMWRGQPAAARDLLLAEADRVEPAEPFWAAIMLAHAALVSVMLGERKVAAEAGRRAVDLLAGLPEAVLMPALVVYALTAAVEGDVAQARAALERCEPHLEAWDPLAPDQLLLVAALAWTSLEEPAQALRWLDRAVRAARAASAIGLLPFQLSWLALALCRAGRWTAAYATAHDAVTLAGETRWETELPNSLVALAAIEAGMGQAEQCRAHVAQALALGEQGGAEVIAARAASALALLELGAGRAGEAARQLRQVGAFVTGHGLGDPVLLSWAGDLVEAYVHAGTPELAGPAYETVLAEAERTRRPTELAVAARCRGLLATAEADVHAAFAEALQWHARAEQPFQQARSRLWYGELLRRHRRRADARTQLAAALEEFERIGAEPWAARAREELRATGQTIRSPGAPNTTALTPQELRVALVVAEGATNAAAAADLFLSAKTVEYHLSSVYRKLGIRSRAQLVRALGATPPT